MKMKEGLENKYSWKYDSWNLLGKELPSKHCKGGEAKIVAYDHTAHIEAKCNCGKVYVHNYSVNVSRSEINTKEADELFAEDDR